MQVAYILHALQQRFGQAEIGEDDARLRVLFLLIGLRLMDDILAGDVVLLGHGLFRRAGCGGRARRCSRRGQGVGMLVFGRDDRGRFRLIAQEQWVPSPTIAAGLMWA
ncbi:hypothetical protein HMPREF9946_00449 [Acetobacteraceae bacterium AT-5844]|nr:hypothetical protein HMPREF9946_00449 [Acetobacteraceae bacterium AT-5844]